MNDVPENRCGYTYPEDFDPDESPIPNTQNCCCRNSLDGIDHCVWHADKENVDRKNLHELRESRVPADVRNRSRYPTESLDGAKLSGIDLRKLGSFARVQFRNADFSKTILEGAELIEADLADADLSDSYLSDSNLSEANLRRAELIGTSFQDADLSKTRLEAADLTDADLKRANLSGAMLLATDLTEASLQQANLSEVGLLGEDLANTDHNIEDLRNFLLDFAEIPEFDIRVDFTGATLRGADLTDASLPSAILSEADLHDTTLTGAKFSEATVVGTNFSEADLTEANFQTTVFSKADLTDTSFKPACDLNPTSDSGNPILEDAQFEDGTDLRGADFSGAKLYQTAFRNVRINDNTVFGIENGSHGRTCRYNYDPNATVTIDEDTDRFKAAAWTHRRLESLFETNAMDQRARNAHILKQEAQRRQAKGSWTDSWMKWFRDYLIPSINYHLHRHGESVSRLLGVSTVLIGLCGVIYSFTGIARQNPEITYNLTLTELNSAPAIATDLLNGLYFSIITFSTIGYGDYYPASPVSQLLVAIESLAGAVFIALFVFVLGRRVAR